MDSILSDDEFHTDAGERTLQVILRLLNVSGANIYRVWVQVRQDLWNRHVYKGVDVYFINILVIDDMQQVVQPVAS